MQAVDQTHAIAQVSFAPPGTAAFKGQRGFVSLAFVAPNNFDLTLEAPLGADEINIRALGRNGFAATATRVSDTVVRVSTYDGGGQNPGAFDLEVKRVLRLAGAVVPPADPAGIPFAGGLDVTPPVFVVAPAALGLPNTYPTGSAAQAAAVAAGYGGVAPTNRALVLWLPGAYEDNIVAVAGIDHAAWDQQRQSTVVVRPVPGSSAPVFSFTSPAGSDSTTTYVAWNGIDIENATEVGDPAVELAGLTGCTLRMQNCRVTSVFHAVLLSNSFLAAGDRSVLELTDVLLQGETGRPLLEAGGEVRHAFSRVSLQCTSPGASAIAAEINGGDGNWRQVRTIGRVEFSGTALAYTWTDTDIIAFAGLGGPIVANGGAIIRHVSGSVSGDAPVASGTGAYFCGLVSMPGAIGPGYFTPTTFGAFPKGCQLTGAVGVVWAGNTPQEIQEAIDRIAAIVAVLNAAPIP